MFFDLERLFDPDRVIVPRSPGVDPRDLPPDWRAEYEERAAIMDHDGGHHREQAEYLALRDILKRMQQEQADNNS